MAQFSNSNYVDKVGSVIGWPTGTSPNGYLECDGAAINRTTYADLFAVISDYYGNGDGSTTFNIPDYRGKFLRGWAHGQVTDPDRATRTDRGDGTTGDFVGTEQPNELQTHNHGVNNAVYQSPWYAAPGHSANPIIYYTTTGSDYIGAETRPLNVNIMYCIKY